MKTLIISHESTKKKRAFLFLVDDGHAGKHHQGYQVRGEGEELGRDDHLKSCCL